MLWLSSRKTHSSAKPRLRAFAGLIIFALGATLFVPTQAATSSAVPGSALDRMVALPHPQSLSQPTSDASIAASQHLRNLAKKYGFTDNEFSVERVIDTGSLATVRFTQAISGIPVADSLISITVNARGALLSYSLKIGRAPQIEPIHSQNSSALFVASAVASALAVSFDSVVVTQLALEISDSAVTQSPLEGVRYVWSARVDFVDSTREPIYVLVDDASGSVITSSSVVRHVADPNPLVCDLQRTDTSYRKSGAPKTILTYSRSKKKYVNVNSTPLPICNIGNVGNTPNLSNAIDASEFQHATTDINQTIQYFKDYVGININDELYLGNVSPLMNYNSKVKSAAKCEDQADDICQPRISAFTNVCAVHGLRYCEYKPGTKKYSSKYPKYYANAFWTAWWSKTSSDVAIDCGSTVCSGIFLGKGYVADDVVAHELAHGVTGAISFTGGLTHDANALSEAYSDFFGEAVDQLTVSPGEAADASFKMGEDVGLSNVPGQFIPDVARGPFRNMQGIGSGQITDISATYSPSADSHTNNGPANYFAWLITHGGTQSDITVTPIGTEPNTAGNQNGLCDLPSECTAITKMTRLAFGSLSHLTASATYFDFGNAMLLACSDLVTANVSDFVSNDCVQVRNALDAIHAFTLKFTSLTYTRLAVVAGSQQTVKATLGTRTSGRIANLIVRLQSSADGVSAWTDVPGAISYTDSTGRASISIRTYAKTYYRFVSAIDPTLHYDATTSDVFSISTR